MATDSTRIPLDIPTSLISHIDVERSAWLQLTQPAGRVRFFNRPGIIQDLEALAVERRHWVAVLGVRRARALAYRIGFEQGRRDAVRQGKMLGNNHDLVFEAGLAFRQLRGYGRAERCRFACDLDNQIFHNEVRFWDNMEALARKMIPQPVHSCACWMTAGYLSGHASEVVGRRVHTVETACLAQGDEACVFLSLLDADWEEDAEWMRQALQMESFEAELHARDLRVTELEQEIAQLESTASAASETTEQGQGSLDELIAFSDAMATVVRQCRQVAETDLPVLLCGPRGSGKQTLARGIHHASARHNGPFETVDCQNMTGDALLRQLFGFERGSYPGAGRSFSGLAARAHGGVLYLHDIRGLSREGQGMLLHLLQEGRVIPVGGGEPVHTDTRIVAAAPCPLEDLRKELQDDLYYALAVAPIAVPPLEERQADILPLAARFLEQFGRQHGRTQMAFSDDALRILQECAWPGNVRQLRQVVEHAIIFSRNAIIGLDDLPSEVLIGQRQLDSESLTPELIRAALKQTKGNRSRAADLLGVSRTTLWRLMTKMDIQ